MFSHDRNALRQVFFDTWNHAQQKKILTPLENQLMTLLINHPEYHYLFQDQEKYLQQDFSQANPFMHLAMHLSLQEQVGTNRPSGIQTIYQQAIKKQHPHDVEHVMMEILAQYLWQLNHNPQQTLNEAAYLFDLKKALSIAHKQ